MSTFTPPPRLFTSLPREAYTSADVFEREIERVFFNQWLLFGHVSEVAAPGDVVVRQVATESVIVTRDQDGALHGFFNVCRHRGSQICDVEQTTAKQLVCPYHRWSYALDGRLLGAPAMRDGVDFEYADYGLRAVELEVWRGFIFVGLGFDAEPERLSAGFGDLAELDVFELERLRLACSKRYAVAANWKLIVENFVECYHCAGSHPELCRALDMKQIYEPLKALAVEGDGRPTPYFSSAIPTPDDVASFTVSGAPASKRPLGRVGELDQLPAMMAIGVFPTFSSVQCFPDYAMTHRLVPLSADRSLLVCDWFVHEDAVEGVDYLLDELVGVWDATNVQDVELCERNQRGVTSRRYVPGPNSVEREPAIRGTLAFYHLMMEEPDRYEALMGHAPA